MKNLKFRGRTVDNGILVEGGIFIATAYNQAFIVENERMAIREVHMDSIEQWNDKVGIYVHVENN